MKFANSKKYKSLDPGTVLLVRQLLLGLLIFLSIGLLLFAVWQLTRISAFTISTVEAQGGKTISASVVTDKANEVLAGTYLGLVPRRFFLFYPEVEIYERVSTIDRIKDVKIETPHNNGIIITYDEYVAEALWCSTATSTECYFLDDSGFSFGLAPNLTGGSFIRFYSLGQDPKKGQRPFKEEDFKAARGFATLLAEVGWYVAKIEIDDVRDVFYTLTPRSEIKGTLIEDYNVTFSHLATIRQSKEFTHLTPGSFQYIDLRFGTKAFVNEESLADLAASSTASIAASSTQETE